MNGVVETTDSELQTTAEVAKDLRAGHRSIWRWSHSGVMPAPVKIAGSAVRFRRREILDWIAQGCPRCDGGPQR